MKNYAPKTPKYNPDEFFSAERRGWPTLNSLCQKCGRLKDGKCAGTEIQSTFECKNYIERSDVFTNADRIQSMDKKRLAEFLNRVESDGRCGNLRGKNGWLDWLRQEADA